MFVWIVEVSTIWPPPLLEFWTTPALKLESEKLFLWFIINNQSIKWEVTALVLQQTMNERNEMIDLVVGIVCVLVVLVVMMLALGL